MTISQINALKRLHRVGDPQSETNRKLREAAQEMRDYLLALTGGESRVLRERGFLPAPGSLLFEYDAGLWVELGKDAPLEALQVFARLVAHGLIEEVERERRRRE